MTDPERNHGKNAPISCPFCGGCLTIERESQEYVQCPFCGEKSRLSDLMGDSEAVRAERVRQKQQEEDLERYLKEEQEKNGAAEPRKIDLAKVLKKTAVFLIIPLLTVILLRMFFLKFGKEIEAVMPVPEKSAAMEEGYWGPTIDWDTVMLREHLPKPSKLYGTWRKIDENSMTMCLEQVDQTELMNYKSQCSAMGYVKEYVPSAKWAAFDPEGYELKLVYRELTSQLEIELSAPIPLEPFSWDDYAVAQLLPVPEADSGFVEFSMNKTLHVFVGGQDLEAVRDYCHLLQQEGFEKTEFPIYDFHGEDSRGIGVSATYCGNSVMELIISADRADVA